MIVDPGLRGFLDATSLDFFRPTAESSVDEAGSPRLRAAFARVSNGDEVAVLVIHLGLRENVFAGVFCSYRKFWGGPNTE